MGADGKRLVIRQFQGGFLHGRTADDIDASAGGYLIESQSRKHIPGRHLAYILVTTESGWLVGVEFAHALAHLLRRFPGLAYVIVEVQGMVAGFVAVGILADESGDVGIGIRTKVAISQEECIQAVDESFLGREARDQSVNIVGHEPSVLPGVALRVVASLMTRVEVGLVAELSFGAQGPHTQALGVEHTLVVHAAIIEIHAVLTFAHQSGHLSRTPVGQVIFQALGHSLAVARVPGHPTVLLHFVQRTIVLEQALLHGLESLLIVKALDVLETEVGEHGHGRTAHHAIRLVRHQVPNGQFALFPVDVEHGLGIVGKLVAQDERGQRMGSAIGVPERPCGVVAELGSVLHASVTAHVVAIDIAPDGRGIHEVVESGIEDAAFLLGAEGCPYARQLGVPGGSGILAHGIEVPFGHFHGHVHHGIHLVHRRQGYLSHDALTRGYLKGGLGVGRRWRGTEPIVDGVGKLDDKVNLLAIGPTVTDAESGQRVVVNLVDARIKPRVANGILEVDDNAGIARATGKRITMESHTVGSRHLGLDVVAVEHYAVIARAHGFRLVAVGCSQPLTTQFQLLQRGHQGYVAQVAATGSAQVHLAETDNLLTIVVIAGTPVPPHFQLRRAHIHHTLRNVGSDENMTMVARPNQGVDIVRQLLGREKACSRQEQNDKSVSFH